nr:MAG TPA: hypothetical protein [Caudoviricetes sp.]
MLSVISRSGFCSLYGHTTVRGKVVDHTAIQIFIATLANGHTNLV